MSTVLRADISAKNEYWISKHRYYELKHFCLQYSEWKKIYISLNGFSHTTGMIREYVNEGSYGDPTEKTAEIRIRYGNRIEIIERSAKDAADDLYLFILKAVTEGLSYDSISPPCCKDVWYRIYRRFFWILDKARN